MSWSNQAGQGKGGDFSSGPRGEIFDRPQYANVYDRLVESFISANLTFESVCRDAMNHHADATFYHARKEFEMMVGIGYHLLQRLKNEAVKKGDLRKFSDRMREYHLEKGAVLRYASMLDYSRRLSGAVMDAEAYGRSIGLFIAERSTPILPWDIAVEE